MNFKLWLNEISLGSDGMRDNQVSQTNQATDQASQAMMQNPKFANHQADWMGMSGNTSALNKTFLQDVTKSMKSIVPRDIGSKTNAGNVAFNLSQSVPIKGLNIPKPKAFMRKWMKKS